MAILGQLTAPIGGGVLSVSDSVLHDDDLADGPHPLVEVGPAQIIVRVQNGAADGDTTVRVASGSVDDPVGPVIFDGTLRVDGGRLRVGDVIDEAVIWVDVPAGNLRMRIHVDDADPDSYPPEKVDVILPEL